MEDALALRPACLVAVLTLAAVPCLAQESGPVCGRPEVLAAVADELAQRGSEAVIQPDAVGQVPTRDTKTVLCAVRLTTQFFDTNRFGYEPQYRAETFQYYVRAARNGLFVRPADSRREGGRP